MKDLSQKSHEPVEEVTQIPLLREGGMSLQIRSYLNEPIMDNLEIFTRSSSNMTRIEPGVISHQPSV